VKKKKLKKLLRQALEKSKPVPKRAHRKPAAKPFQHSQDVLSLMQKVKRQLEDLKKPAWPRIDTSWQPTTAEYRAMDRTLSMMQVDPRLYKPGP